MARTDKTAPWRVKMFYETCWLEEMHHHENGVCDLPPRPRSPKDKGWEFHQWNRGYCYWVASYSQFWTHPLSRCCCPMCKRYAYSKDPAKADRRAAKRYCKDGWHDEY